MVHGAPGHRCLAPNVLTCKSARPVPALSHSQDLLLDPMPVSVRSPERSRTLRSCPAGHEEDGRAVWADRQASESKRYRRAQSFVEIHNIRAGYQPMEAENMVHETTILRHGRGAHCAVVTLRAVRIWMDRSGIFVRSSLSIIERARWGGHPGHASTSRPLHRRPCPVIASLAVRVRLSAGSLQGQGRIREWGRRRALRQQLCSSQSVSDNLIRPFERPWAYWRGRSCACHPCGGARPDLSVQHPY